MKTNKYLTGIMACLILLIWSSCQDKQSQAELAKFKQAELIKAINFWAVEDELGMMNQLGMELKLKK